MYVRVDGVTFLIRIKELAPGWNPTFSSCRSINEDDGDNGYAHFEEGESNFSLHEKENLSSNMFAGYETIERMENEELNVGKLDKPRKINSQGHFRNLLQE